MPLNLSPADAVVHFFHDVDRCEWDKLAEILADTIEVDYRSLNGGAAEQLSSEQLLDRWRSLLPGFDATQHFLAPSVTTELGEDTLVECNVRGYHRLAQEHGQGGWMVAGRYEIWLRPDGAGWQITGITLQTTYQDGDLDLPKAAAARAAAASSREAVQNSARPS